MNTQNVKTFRILLSGRVQGVGYRYFVEEKASIYHITGYVKNTAENNVEITCRGSEENLEKFIAIVKRGPAFANVTGFLIDEIKNPVVYNSFKIEY
jgi:acylphosphatase